MDPYPFVDEPELPLPGFAEVPGCSAALEAGLDALELPDLGLLPLVDSKEADADAGGRGGSGAARRGRPAPGAFLDCSLCGKVLGSASSLSKHYLSHSQERKHVCGVCSKAFKRQDHLSGHMLTHQKTKPFACLEEGCAKSYCDHRSLRRHRELQHGLCAPRAPRADDGAAAAPGPSAPGGELLRCVLSGFGSQKLPARPDAAAPWPPCSSPRPAPCAGASGDPFACPTSAAASSVFAVVGESGGAGWTDGSLLAEPPERGAGSALPRFPVFRGPRSSPQPGGSLQWVPSAPVCTKSSSLCPERADGFSGAPAALQPPQRSDALPFAASRLLLAPQPLPATFCPEPAGCQGSSLLLPGSLAQPHTDLFPDNASGGPLAGPAFQSLQPGPLQERAGARDASVPGGAAGCRSYGKPSPLENQAPGAKRKERSGGAGGRAPAAVGRSRRPPGIRRERLEAAVASPSQVAMASFSAERPRLTIFNRIQGGNIYSFTSAVKEESVPPGCNQTSGVPTDGGRSESGFVCKSCSQLFCTETGLESHMCLHGEHWYSPERQEEPQENGNAQELLQQLEVGSSPYKAEPRAEAAAPLVIPVSVPVTIPVPPASGEEDPGRLPKVSERESREAQDLRDSVPQKKRKRPACPKSLFIPPPPPSCEAPPAAGGCFRSHLRSPVFLVDHLLRDLFQSSPYTPPPMLSPIREGSGLYFSTLCNSTCRDPNQLFSAVLDRMDRDFGFCLVRDNTKISIVPHINIGSRFQAEIPALRDRSNLEDDDQAASLVWKPWGDIATNRETQDRVTGLLNMACSSAMPGGGTNLELALHCLHEARGDVLEALEMLLFGGPHKSGSHPLADYRYAGSDSWTPLERQLFQEAFCAHKKDFYLIQKQIQTKNVAQCVEYYYIWKKIIRFDCGRVQVVEKKVKRDKNELERTEEKPARSPPGKPGRPREGAGMKPRSGAEEPAGAWSAFPCRQCERVFAKIKSRNAHMKRHRPQEPRGALPWPARSAAEPAAAPPLPE